MLSSRHRSASLFTIVVLATAAGLAGCGGESEDSPSIDPSFYEEVAPILASNCSSCHKPGGIAPFSLLTYEDAKQYASLIAPAVESRRMPPWSADNSGDCHTWEGARWLSDDDIQTIAAWSRGEQIEGDPANAPDMLPEEVGLSKVDATLDMGIEYTPDPKLADDYRCFVVDYSPATQKFLTAFEVKPGESRVVHHILFFGLDSATQVSQAESLDAAAAGPGYTCFGGSGVNGAPLLGVWAPGVRVNRYPANTGLKVPANGKMIIQIHYNLQAGPLPDRTTIDLELADSVTKEAFLALTADPDLALPPGQKAIATSGVLNVPNILGAEFEVWAMYPHMHTLGTSMRVERERAGEPTECMLDVPRWDFNWQQFFNYADGPIIAKPNDAIRITCSYNTMGRTETVTWGEGTLDEMCLSFLYTTLR